MYGSVVRSTIGCGVVNSERCHRQEAEARARSVGGSTGYLLLSVSATSPPRYILDAPTAHKIR